ncbi:MAG: hypothetical protein RTU63_08575 [Candidatus Thorarchaeota archaeon]
MSHEENRCRKSKTLPKLNLNSSTFVPSKPIRTIDVQAGRIFQKIHDFDQGIVWKELKTEFEKCTSPRIECSSSLSFLDAPLFKERKEDIH